MYSLAGSNIQREDEQGDVLYVPSGRARVLRVLLGVGGEMRGEPGVQPS